MRSSHYSVAGGEFDRANKPPSAPRGPGGRHHLVSDPGHLNHFRIVHPDDVRPSENRRRDCRRGAPGTVSRRQAAKSVANKSLAGRADDEGEAEPCQARQMSQQLIILGRTLSESQAWIDEELGRSEAGAERSTNGCGKPGTDIGENIARERPLLHGLRSATHVHQDERRPVPASDPGQIGVVPQTGNVVYDFGAGAERSFGHNGLAGVDGQGNLQPAAEPPDQGNHPLEFGFGLDGKRTRPRGLPADIEDIDAGGFKLECMAKSGIGTKVQAAVGEAVGRDVQDTHDEGAVTERERARREAQ